MSHYGADPTPDLSRVYIVVDEWNIAPQTSVKADQYTQPDSTLTFHLVDKHTRSSLWIHADPTQYPPS